ncbi:MAG: nickel pincer cofactor biosynthesis protein LarC [Desulfobacterales bacterium]|nr:nickel pincer cofactor biosynthesis protein LarC [Desulfobacterales bacterium]
MRAYFDCFSGISGDMTLGAFVDLGVPVQWLVDELKKIPLSGFELSATEVSVHGISAKRVNVDVLKESGSRNYSQIQSMILSSPFSQSVKDRSGDIFDRLATAEAGIHNCPNDSVHFHEVGGVDAIVDIVGTALCLEFLGIETIEVSKIPLGSGFVKCRHGTLPVPAPATLAILKGVPVYGTEIPFELVTPTGAAIVAALSRSFGKMKNMVVQKVGYGAGTYQLESTPNLLRIILGQEPIDPEEVQSKFESDTILVIETGIDDMNPEVLGYTMERLFAKGALDVCLFPVYMKKNRPGTMLQVLCHEDRKDEIVGCILAETTSLGVRYYASHRQKLKREKILVETSFGPVQVKKIKDPSGGVRIVPEFEVCKKIALERHIPLQRVYETIIKETLLK